MRSPEPPRLAVWLLERCGGSESLVGDLVERYRRGQSAAWLWRQVVTAAMVGAATDIRSHKLLAMRGVFAGMAFLFLFQRFIQAPLSHLDDWLFVTGLADVRSAWPNHRFLMMALGCVGGTCCGWTVVRWHRTSTVFLFVAFLMLFDVLWYWLVAVPAVRSTPAFVWSLPGFLIVFVFIVFPTTILLGGLWGVSEGNGRADSNTITPS